LNFSIQWLERPDRLHLRSASASSIIHMHHTIRRSCCNIGEAQVNGWCYGVCAVRYTVVEKKIYINIVCEQYGSSDQPKELMLCDKYDNGFHMKCARSIVVNNWSRAFHVKTIVTFITQHLLLRLVIDRTLLTMMLTYTTTYPQFRHYIRHWRLLLKLQRLL
jgi:hypothetical protein